MVKLLTMDFSCVHKAGKSWAPSDVAEIIPHFHFLLHKILLLLSKILIFLSLFMVMCLRVGVARTSSNILDAMGMNL